MTTPETHPEDLTLPSGGPARQQALDALAMMDLNGGIAPRELWKKIFPTLGFFPVPRDQQQHEVISPRDA